MNKTQRENLAKYSYDFSKLIFAGFVITNIMSEKFSLSVFIAGIIGFVSFILTGYALNQKE